MRTKAAVRREAAERRHKLPPGYRIKASSEIAGRLMSEGVWKSASAVFLYYGYGDEVQTEELIEAALKENKAAALPKVISDSEMAFIRFTSLQDMQKGAFGIPEPVGDKETGCGFRPDIIIVPCVAVDRRGNRAGHGKGYYDRFLKEYSDSLFVCTAFDCQLTEEFEAEDTDIKMDMIITEKEIIRI